jgi:hypothetical protein
LHPLALPTRAGCSVSPDALRKPLVVEFAGEEGLDQGGLTKASHAAIAQPPRAGGA